MLSDVVDDTLVVDDHVVDEPVCVVVDVVLVVDEPVCVVVVLLTVVVVVAVDVEVIVDGVGAAVGQLA